LTVWVLAWGENRRRQKARGGEAGGDGARLEQRARGDLAGTELAHGDFPFVVPRTNAIDAGALEKNINSRGPLPNRHRPPKGQIAMHARSCAISTMSRATARSARPPTR